MSDTVLYRYKAFLSYSHKDTDWVVWLHKALENYAISKDLIGRETARGFVPGSLRPIFRDRDDFSGGHSLKAATMEALEASEFLIVLCSPNAAASIYVNEEVRAFKALGRSSQVIPVIISGEPGDADKECFPPAVKFTVDDTGALTNELAEPVCPDARASGDGRKRALSKIVAGLIGVSHDDIIKRSEIDWRRRMLVRVATAATFALVVVFAAFQYFQLQETSALAATLINGSGYTDTVDSRQARHGVSETLSVVQTQAEGGDAAMAEVLELLIKGNVAEAESLLRQIALDLERRDGAERAQIAAAWRRVGAIAGLSNPAGAREAYGKVLDYESDDLEALYWHGWLSFRANHFDIAEAQLRKLLSLARAKNDDQAAFQANLRLGELLDETGFASRGRPYLEAALEMADRRVEAEPQETEAQANLAEVHEKLGDMERDISNDDVAIDHYRDALAIRQRLADAAPGERALRRDVFSSLWRIADMQQRRDDLAAAEATLERGRVIIAGIAAQDPEHARWQRDLSFAHSKRAALELAQGDHDAALASYRQSMVIRQALVAEDATNARWRSEVAWCHGWIADVYLAADDVQSARTELDRGYAIRTTLVESDPINTKWQQELAISHEALGRLHAGLGSALRAMEHHTAALDIRQALTRQHGTNAYWQDRLARSHKAVAELDLAAFDHDSAKTHLEAVLAVRVLLTSLDPTVARWQYNLAVAHWDLAVEGFDDDRHWASVVETLQPLRELEVYSATVAPLLEYALTQVNE